MLRLEGISVSYGGLTALQDVSMAVKPGQLVAVIGSNGAGKSTLFKTISGIVPAASGRIMFRDEDISKRAAFERAGLGIAHVPEGRQVFKSMTVMDNLELGGFRLAARQRFRQNLDMIFSLFPVLHERREQLAGTMSGGQQQMLAIGRGLAADPDLLMLDEPSMGLAPAVVDQIFESILQLHREKGLTILLVEQRAAEALEGCDHGYVLETGSILLQGDSNTLMTSPMVRNAYLGLS